MRSLISLARSAPRISRRVCDKSSVGLLRARWRNCRSRSKAYERLHLGKSREVVLAAVEDLPQALIHVRIAAGMTQAGLARRLGVKPQQVQRYEATDYGKASFARILKVVQALGLTMPKAVRLVRNG